MQDITADITNIIDYNVQFADPCTVKFFAARLNHHHKFRSYLCQKRGLSIKNSALPFDICKCSWKLDVCLYMASGLTSSKIILEDRSTGGSCHKRHQGTRWELGN